MMLKKFTFISHLLHNTKKILIPPCLLLTPSVGPCSKMECDWITSLSCRPLPLPRPLPLSLNLSLFPLLVVAMGSPASDTSLYIYSLKL